MHTNEKTGRRLQAVPRVNRIWLDGQVEALATLVDTNIVMVVLRKN